MKPSEGMRLDGAGWMEVKALRFWARCILLSRLLIHRKCLKEDSKL